MSVPELPEKRLTAILFGATERDDADALAAVEAQLHDQLLAMLGTARRSGVTWSRMPADKAPGFLADAFNIGLEQWAESRAMLEYLRDNPGGWLVVASATYAPGSEVGREN